eukprot:gb/GECH01012242.1/.p1 GENE.gb/GECH01012242.1/~~gb/GECH01012242.1/.p1  ORF type:complete len:294 (+),score=66.37 gb/GECH01012242.1/:1-882(+)
MLTSRFIPQPRKCSLRHPFSTSIPLNPHQQFRPTQRWRNTNHLCTRYNYSNQVSNMSQIMYVGQETAQNIDADLMGDLAFSVDQLMELAGLSVAAAIHTEYAQHVPKKTALIVCGPGNNGGDGLVAARHLFHFGWDVSVWYPKPSSKELFQRLQKQLHVLNIPIVKDPSTSPDTNTNTTAAAAVLVDAVFGFSFRGALRAPFDQVIPAMHRHPGRMVSIDVPSGWGVEQGPPDSSDAALRPDMLVSLSVPKLCAQSFSGTHYLGGRFIPPSLAAKYGFQIPEYPGSEPCVKLG